MLRLIITLLWFAASLSASSAQAQIGTAPREEVEAKFALDQLDQDAGKELAQDLFHVVGEMLPQLRFGPSAYCTIKQDRRPVSFAFVDDYLDTPRRDMWHAGASYRLRRRWNPYHHYVRHQLFPWSSLFPPVRVEIQAKTGYKPAGWYQLSVQETRLEFRKESSPFNEGFPLLHLSSPVEEFVHIARSGWYEGHRIYPYAMLLRPPVALKPKAELEVVLSLLSLRHRFHLDCRHPLGWGPNPQQIFIITVDQLTCLRGCCQRTDMVEIEIEQERNTSTMLQQFQSYEASALLRGEPAAQKAFDYTHRLRQAYDDDHLTLRRSVHRWLTKNAYQPLAPSAKYRRFLCADKSL